MSNLSNVYSDINSVLAGSNKMYKCLAALERKHNISLFEVTKFLNAVEDKMKNIENNLENLEDSLATIKTMIEREI